MDGRKKITSLMSILVLILTSSSLLFVFQNCGSMEVGDLNLHGSSLGVSCVGVNCERNLNEVGFFSTISGFTLDMNNGTGTATCNNSTCADIGGFCETGGYTGGSVFYYQWFIGGTAPIAEVKTTSACDENGRFKVTVKVPATGFDWTKSHRLRLFMKVIDDDGTEVANPTGEGEFTYFVNIRSP